MNNNITIKLMNIIYSILGIFFYFFMNKIAFNFWNIFYAVIIVFIGFALQLIVRILFISFKNNNKKKASKD